jgi:hypothetical protein
MTARIVTYLHPVRLPVVGRLYLLFSTIRAPWRSPDQVVRILLGRRLIGAAGDDEIEWPRFLATSDRDFRAWLRRVSPITDGDARWFQITSSAEKLRTLASQIIELGHYLEQSTAKSKMVGAELLD